MVSGYYYNCRRMIAGDIPRIGDRTMNEIQKTILQQLGGLGRLTALIGVKSIYTGSDAELRIRWSARGKKKINVVSVSLRPDDYYDVTFAANGRSPLALPLLVTSRYEGVGCEDLVRIFEEETGLYLTLFPKRG